MAEQNGKLKRAEQRISEELANQASDEPGSAEAEQAKEKRAQAEEDLAKARTPDQKSRK
jgi:hypothetical protein